MKTLIVVVAALVAACGGEDVPSCQQAIGDFYGAGCTFFDPSTNPPVATTQNQALNACQQINSAVPDQCMDEFEDWKICISNVTGPSDTECASCSDESDRLFACD